MMLSAIENVTLHNVNNNGNVNSQENHQDNTLTHNATAPKAILICHPNSHAFLDRTLILDKPVKIGRSVGHSKATLNNAIFDCKVLSRYHAVIWFSDDKFFVKDTKSSNGTFVNTERLSRSVEESNAKEIFFGDTLQFGVDVVENSRNVTHGCIIATVKLYLQDGKEAKPKCLPMLNVSDNNKLSLENLYNLNKYIQEALQRENMLETKLSYLKEVIASLKESTEESWKALISNNSLLSRVELLEVQLQCYSKKFPDDKLREELRLLQKDRSTYQDAVKEYLQKMLDEKLEAVQRSQDLNRALINSRTECSNSTKLLSDCHNELNELAKKYALQEKTLKGLEDKVISQEEKYKDMYSKLTQKNKELQNEVKEKIMTEQLLHQTIKELEAHGDYAQKRSLSLQLQVEQLQKHHTEMLCLLIDPNMIKDKLNNADLVNAWISIYSKALEKANDNYKAISDKVKELNDEKIAKQQSITSIERELNKSNTQLSDLREASIKLDGKIRLLENDLEEFKPVPDIIDCSIEEIDCKKQPEDVDSLSITLQEKNNLLLVIQKNIAITNEQCKDLDRLLQAAKTELMEVTVSYLIEEDKLAMAQKQILDLELAIDGLSENLESLTTIQQDIIPLEQIQQLKGQLLQAHDCIQEKDNFILKLFNYISLFTKVTNTKFEEIEKNTIISKSFITTITTANANANDEYNNLILENTLNDICKDCEDLSSSIQGVEDCLSFIIDNSLLICRNNNNNNSNNNSNNNNNSSLNLNEWPISCGRNTVSMDFNVLKEKYKILLTDKVNLERRLFQLEKEFDNSINSYPYLDVCFILPIAILIFVVFFNYSSMLSFVFGTSD